MQVDSTGRLSARSRYRDLDPDPGDWHLPDNSTAGLLTALTGSPLALYTGKGTTATVVDSNGMLITPSNSYVYVSLASLGVQVLTLGTGGALSTGSARPRFCHP